MNLLQKPIQRKLSALLGAEVTFDKLNISLLGGTIDAHGMTVAGDDAASPVLTVARARAEIAVAKALKGEIVVKSLTVERPVVSVVRRADGRTNLPRPPQAVAEAAAATMASDGPAAPAPAYPEPSDEEKDASRWRFDAQQVLLVDGELSYRDESADDDGFRAASGKVLAELTHAGDGFDFTLVVESVRREGSERDGGRAVTTIGPIHVAGRLAGAADVTQLARATLTGTADAADLLHARVASASLAERRGEAEVHGDADLAALASLVPPNVPALTRLRNAAPAGRVQFQLRARYDPADGLKVSEFQLRATDLAARV